MTATHRNTLQHTATSVPPQTAHTPQACAHAATAAGRHSVSPSPARVRACIHP